MGDEGDSKENRVTEEYPGGTAMDMVCAYVCDLWCLSERACDTAS